MKLLIGLILILPNFVFGQDYTKYNSIGESFLKRGNIDSAEVYFSKSIDLQPNKLALLNLSTVNIKKGVWGRAIILAHEIPLYAADDYEYISKSFFNVGLAEELSGNISYAILNYKMSLVPRKDSLTQAKLSELEQYLNEHYSAGNFLGEWIAYDYELSPGSVGAMSDEEAKKLLNKIYLFTTDHIKAPLQTYSLENADYIKCNFGEDFEGYDKINKLFANSYSKKIIQMDVDNDKEFDRFIFINDNVILTGMDGNFIFLKRKQ